MLLLRCTEWGCLKGKVTQSFAVVRRKRGEKATSTWIFQMKRDSSLYFVGIERYFRIKARIVFKKILYFCSSSAPRLGEGDNEVSATLRGMLHIYTSLLICLHRSILTFLINSTHWGKNLFLNSWCNTRSLLSLRWWCRHSTTSLTASSLVRPWGQMRFRVWL